MATIKLGTSAYGTISTLGEHDTFTVDLVAGTQYEFRLHGVGANQIIDPVLRLYSNANLVGSNDDAGAATWGGSNGTDSRLVYAPTTSGTYTIDVGGFNEARTGDYLVTAVQANAQGMVFTNDEIAWQLGNNFWEWSGPAGSTGRQSGPSAFNVGSDLEITVDLSRLDATETNLATWALFTWSMATSITFRDVGASGNAEITFFENNRNANGWQANAGADAWASGTSGTITHSFVHVDHNWLYGVGTFAGYGTTFNSYGFETYIHEIGHALGLGHGGNYDGSGTYGTSNYYLNDALAYSMMSYWQAANDEFSNDPLDAPNQQNTFVPASFRYMLGPQPADIIAIRELYGLDVNSTQTLVAGAHAGYAANSGNNHYGYNSNGSIGIPFLETAYTYGADGCYTIFDTAGTDTIDYSGFSGTQTINLNPETFSNVNGGLMNLAIARGVTIENAIGGSGADTIHGNVVDNGLTGGGGGDTIYGNDGNDTVIAGAGVDYVQGDTGNDSIYGGDGNDILHGGDGGDLIYGDNTDTSGNGADTIYGENGDDTIIAGDGSDWVDGGIANDSIYGNNGADILAGWDGNDYLDGGFGTDQLYGNAGNDVLMGGLNVSGQDADDLMFGGDGNDSLYGGAGNDQMLGENNDDVLLGQLGNDYLQGGTGNDSLFGGANNDTFDGGAGNDYLVAGDTGGVADGASDAFYFRGVWGVDTISGFGDSGGDQDILYFEAAIVGNFANVYNNMNQINNDVLLAIDSTHGIWILNMTKAALYDDIALF